MRVRCFRTVIDNEIVDGGVSKQHMQQVALVAALVRRQLGDDPPPLRYELLHSRAQQLQHLRRRET
jgi:hypothetical protein